MDIVELLASLKKENGAEYIKVYFKDENNYTVKFIKDDVCFKRISKGSKSFDLKEQRKKGVVDKKKTD